VSDKPTIVVVATYDDVEDAKTDYEALLDSHKEGDVGHLAVGILSKDEDGTIHVHRHDTTAKHLAWGGAAVGAFLAVLVPPVGFTLLSSAVVGGTMAGAGGLVGHFWHNIPKKDLRELADALDDGTAALVAVGVDKQQEEIDKVLTHAAKRVDKKLDKGDLEGAYEAAVAGELKAEEVAGR
jgi:uncharacterized membrane protein